ncbi:hypothetical protein AVEN_129947-1 [Araneus ventricosus]|uniref:Uncharacterized protein n=1 Tax=Araneus ventricosus TaxID=182803 RepID=A0A4Y2IW64_ARAVE|nr:hypothetical protein AVEN_129947-1 [Araneus ventricosus]
MAMHEALLIAQGKTREINTELLPFFPNRTREAIKGQRRQRKYKDLVAEYVQCNPLSSDALDSTGTLSSAPAATPFTNTRHLESSSLAAAVSDTVHPRANAIEESLGVSSAVRAGKLVS